MENSFAATQHKFCYQTKPEKADRGELRASKLPKKEKVGIEKEVCHKSIWRSFNIFSKIKKFNRGRSKDAAETIEEELIAIDKEDQLNIEECKSKKMDDNKPIKSNCNNGVEEDNVSVESKSSFFGKMNLENLLKIFVDLHKKKQLNQNSETHNKETATSRDSIPIKTIENIASNLNFDLPANNSATLASLREPKQLQNPVNSPSLINTELRNNDSQNNSIQSDSICDTDSTLSLLNNVSIKLKDYLMSEHKTGEDVDKVLHIDEIEREQGIFTIAEDAVAQNDEIQIDENQKQRKSQENQQSECSKDSGDKKMAYTIVETDIKRMIKELLEESKDLKSSIVATGVEEEPTVSFTQLSKSYDSFFMCRNLCNDLINLACNAHAFTLKSRKHLNVTFRQDVEKDVECILTTLVENVLNRKCPQQQLCINFCLVETNFRNKSRRKDIDDTQTKFRESNVYILTKKLRKLQPTTITYPPKVTVHNLSTTKRIKLVPSEHSLTNRIRRSAALLMALYDEMRDYSYYSCTSNILCDLYGSMIKQGLISLTNLKPERSIEAIPPAENESSRKQTATPQLTQTLTAVTLSYTYNNNPTTSYSNASNITEIATTTSPSKDSSSSESEEEIYSTNKRFMLPNLKYTYQSDEEINTAEEVKLIDENATRNGACRDMNVKDIERLQEQSSDDYPYVSINEDEAFLKE